jgi:N-acetylmuramoyl-L-alanine amidase
MIFVSAGHHAHDPGAVFASFQEHAEAVIWRDMIRAEIEGRFGKSVCVPDGHLSEKIQFINSNLKEFSIALEVHFNSGPQTAKGSESLYCENSESGLLFAHMTQEVLGDLFPPSRGAKVGYFRMDPTNPVDAFLRQTHCPAVIIEPEFVHRFDVIQRNRRQACQEIAAQLIRVEDMLRDTEK